MKNQKGFSIIENMVAMSVMGIASFGFIATSVTAISMKKAGIERSAAARAADTAVNPLFYLRGDKVSLVNEISSFPKTVNEKETGRNYEITIASMQDHAGSAVSAASLGDHGVVLLTLNVPYSDRIGTGVGVANKFISPTYTLKF